MKKAAFFVVLFFVLACGRPVIRYSSDMAGYEDKKNPANNSYGQQTGADVIEDSSSSSSNQLTDANNNPPPNSKPYTACQSTTDCPLGLVCRGNVCVEQTNFSEPDTVVADTYSEPDTHNPCPEGQNYINGICYSPASADTYTDPDVAVDTSEPDTYNPCQAGQMYVNGICYEPIKTDTYTEPDTYVEDTSVEDVEENHCGPDGIYIEGTCYYPNQPDTSGESDFSEADVESDTTADSNEDFVEEDVQAENDISTEDTNEGTDTSVECPPDYKFCDGNVLKMKTCILITGEPWWGSYEIETCEFGCSDAECLDEIPTELYCTISCDYPEIVLWIGSADYIVKEQGKEFQIDIPTMCNWGEPRFEFNTKDGDNWPPGEHESCIVECRFGEVQLVQGDEDGDTEDFTVYTIPAGSVTKSSVKFYKKVSCP